MAENKGFGTPGYLNPNCWLVSNSKTQAFQRCRYCRLRWRNCLSFQFLIVTLIALAALGVLALFQVPPFTTRTTQIMGGALIILATIYGYFFNRGADQIAKTSYQLEQKISELQQKISEEQ